ncbi:MAG TPA: hypothetical protein VFR97_13725 [Capillimicrobium sp.]|nr:hypothetical protein [Capillimicrobium sp.]
MTPLPPIDRLALPADIRTSGRDVQERYEAGLGFERQLVAQLAKQLSATAGETLTSGPYAQLLPDALADSIAAAGGLGLARTLADDTEAAA